jgi:integrase
MSKKLRIPRYRFHKASQQAVVVIQGKSTYLGKWNSPESRAEYERLIAEWLENRRCPATSGNSSGLRVNELILTFWRHAGEHYRHPDGRPTGELDNFRDALRPLRKIYGHTLAKDFGPLALRTVREEMIKAGLCRRTINARINRVRRVFRWATSIEMIPPSIIIALETVPGLQRGRCDARESAGVKPVDWADVEATLPFLSRPIAAMVLLMRYTNCRADDAVVMRGCDIRMEGDIWTYRPANHKNQWRGHERVMHLGLRAQEVIRPFLKPSLQAYFFSPREAVEEYHAQRNKNRKTKETPSELKRRRHKRHARRQPGLHFTVNTFQQCVRRACRKAAVPAWTVLQVRHTRAIEVRERYGVEGAQASLGNRRVETAQIYAERNDLLAQKIAREIG